MSINARNLTEGIVVKTLDAAGAITEANGFQYIDGSLLPSVIQKMAITAVLAKSWVVPGIACTEEFQEGIDPNKVWSIWVEVQADIGPTTRTVGPMVQQTITELLTLHHPLLQQPFHLKLN